MTKNKLNFKTRFFAGIVAIFLLIANGGIVLLESAKQALSNIAFAVYAPTEVTFNNGDFSSPSAGTLPYSPTNWTAQNKTGDVVAGVINLEQSTFEEKQEATYKLSFRPDTTALNDNQVLMINSKDTNSSCGYKSSQFSVSNSGYYILTFKAYTENTSAHSAFATAFLSGDDYASTQVLRINTSDGSSSNWQEYSIFIETDDINSKSLNLELWLGEKDGRGSNGAVFFDDVEIYSYTNYDYNTKLANRNTNRSVVISYKQNLVEDFISNPSFEDDLTGWTIIDESSSTSANNVITGAYYVNDHYNSALTYIEDNPTNANIYGNKKALLINNLVAGHIGYRSETFTVQQNGLYKLSFLAKTGDIDGDVTVKLVERNPYTNEYLSDGSVNPNYYANSTYEAQTFTISSISTTDYENSKTNNWELYSFYIEGSPYLDSELSLELWLGTTDADATGYVFFDNFTLEKLSSSDYSNGSSNGTVANLNQATTSTDFENGTFNAIVLDSATDTAPYTPESWTLTQSNISSFNGIINTANTDSSIPSITPISSRYPNNNVLMIGNTADNNQKYTSSSVTLNADSYYKVEVSVLTYNLNKAYAGIRLVGGSNVIGEQLYISSNNAWTTYSFLIKTGLNDENVTLQLSLGETAEGTGYAFFDNVILTSDLTEDDYNATLANCKKINLAEYDFSNIPEQNTDGIFAPYDFNAENKGGVNENYVISGVIDTSKYDTDAGYNGSSLDNPSHPTSDNSNVLMIHSVADVYYAYSSIESLTLTADNYYKIEISIKTVGISQNEDNKVAISGSTTEYYPYGASIVVDGINASFTGIDTDGEWKTYTVYVNCTANSSINISLALGSENALTSGAVYFSSVKINNIEQDDYTTGVAVLSEDNAPDNILAIGNTDVEEETTTSSSSSSDINFDWLVVPSLITALAIIISVSAVIIRNIKKHSKKKPVIAKSYSNDNIKKLNENHKNEISRINGEIKKLNKEQTELAVEINNAKAGKETNKSVEELEKAYNQNKIKHEKLYESKLAENKNFKEKMKELEEEKKADKNR